MKKICENLQYQIRELRKKGLTHRQISNLLKISIGSVVFYSKNIILSPKQHSAIKLKQYRISIGKLTKQERIKASKKGGCNTNSHFPIKYTKTHITKAIKNFYNKHGRIPTKRDFVKLYRPALRVFKTWNYAVRMAGFTPNEVLFSKKYTANDGHRCDSLSEKIIDDWLFARKIPHERNCRYPKGKYTADFRVGNRWIEFFGLKDGLRSYNKIMHFKIKLAEQFNLQLICLYPSDIHPTSSLDIKLADII